MKEIRLRLHSKTGLISNSSTTVIMCTNTYTVGSVKSFLEAVLLLVMPDSKVDDLFDITLEWNPQYLERQIENILDEAHNDESIPEDERDSAGVDDYKDYPAVAAFVDAKLKEYLPEEPDCEGMYYDSDYEMPTKDLCIRTKDGRSVPDDIAGYLYGIFSGQEICC